MITRQGVNIRRTAYVWYKESYLFVFSQQFRDDKIERFLAAILPDLFGELFVVLCGWRRYYHHQGSCPLEEVLRLQAIPQIVEVFRFCKRPIACEARWERSGVVPSFVRGKRKYLISRAEQQHGTDDSRGTSIKIGSRAGNRVTSEPCLTHDVQLISD